MKVSELVSEVREEIVNRKAEIVKGIVSDRLEEIEVAKIVLKKLDEDFKRLLEKDVEEVYLDYCG